MATSSTSSPFSDTDGIWEVDDGLWQIAVPTNTPVTPLSNKTASYASSHSTPAFSQVDAAVELPQLSPPQLSPNTAFWTLSHSLASVTQFQGGPPTPISHISTSSPLATMTSPQSVWSPATASSQDAVETNVSSFGNSVSEAETQNTMQPELVQTHDQNATSAYDPNPFSYAHNAAGPYASISHTATPYYTPMTWAQRTTGHETNAAEQSNQEAQPEAETFAASIANSAQNNVFQSPMYTYMYPDTNQYHNMEQSYTAPQYTFAGTSNVAQFNPQGYGDSCTGCTITHQNVGGTCIPNAWGHCQYCWRTLWGEHWASYENNGQEAATAKAAEHSTNSGA